MALCILSICSCSKDDDEDDSNEENIVNPVNEDNNSNDTDGLDKPTPANNGIFGTWKLQSIYHPSDGSIDPMSEDRYSNFIVYPDSTFYMFTSSYMYGKRIQIKKGPCLISSNMFVIIVDYLKVKNYNDIECKSLFSLEERIKNTDNTTKTTLTYYLEDGSVDEIRHYEDPIEEELFDILKLTNNELQMRYFFNDIELVYNFTR